MNPVTPYAGQSQQSQINVPATVAYKQVWEDGPWVMPPYQLLYPQETTDWVPPPVKQLDIFLAQQTWPL